MNRYSITSTVLLLSISLNVESASHGYDRDDMRQLEAHVHGLAELTVAQEGSELELNLRSPAANIVGFEHKASSSEQVHSVEEAKQTLLSGKRNFLFSGTDCGLEHAKVDVSSLIDVDDHEQHKEGRHDDHHKEEHHDDHHEDHKDEHAHAEQGHDEHHHDEDHEATHSEVTAVYHFECERGDRLTSIRVDLFDQFPGIKKLNAQWVSDQVQGGAELSKSSRIIRLR